MSIPETLRYKLDHFRGYGRIVATGTELFQNPSWLAVYIGQFIIPERFDPLVDQRPRVESKKQLDSLRRVMRDAAGIMPSHRAYIDEHCRAAAM